MQAIYSFPEECSSFVINRNYEIISPYGLKSLFDLKIMLTSFCEENEIDVFHDRILKKKWLIKWPKLNLYKQPETNCCRQLIQSS